MRAPDLASAIDAAATKYYRLVLLVGPPGSGKTRHLRDLAEVAGYPYVSAGTAAARLLEFTEGQRRQRIALVMLELLQAVEGSVVLLDDIELLFEPSLAVDPLRLLQSLTRNRTLVAAWPGRLSDDILTYADGGHPEYRAYNSPAAVLVIQSPT